LAAARNGDGCAAMATLRIEPAACPQHGNPLERLVQREGQSGEGKERIVQASADDTVTSIVFDIQHRASAGNTWARWSTMRATLFGRSPFEHRAFEASGTTTITSHVGMVVTRELGRVSWLECT